MQTADSEERVKRAHREWGYIAPLAILWIVPLVLFGLLVPIAQTAQSEAIESPPVTTIPVGERTEANPQGVDVALNLPAPIEVDQSAAGTVTSVEIKSGDVVTAGTKLDSVDYQEVVAFTGPSPLYRDLALGDSGPDVGSLSNFLVATKFLSQAAVSSTYGRSISRAVGAFERSVSAPPDGQFHLQFVAYIPDGVSRVAGVKLAVGGPSGPSTPVFSSAGQPTSVRFAVTGTQGQAPSLDSHDLTLAAGSIKLRLSSLTLNATERSNLYRFLLSAVNDGSVTTAQSGATTTYSGAVLSDTHALKVGVVPTSAIYLGAANKRCVFVEPTRKSTPKAVQLSTTDIVNGELAEVGVPTSLVGHRVVRDPLSLASKIVSSCK
jgi:hypothetical protein